MKLRNKTKIEQSNNISVLNSKYNKYNKYNKGFTLIELLIVVAIIAILAAIAVPGYDAYMVAARRAEAKAIMMRGALWMERNQSTSFGYDKDAAGVALTTTALTGQGLGRSPENSPTDASAVYVITLATPTPAGFEIIGTANAKQAGKDPNCAVLSLNNLGQRGRRVLGVVEYNTTQARACWAN